MSKPIESFFPTNVPVTESACSDDVILDDATKKRTRSENSSTSSSSSPVSKKTIYDGEDEVFSIPDNAPVWLTMLIKTMDSMSAKMNDLASKFDDISTNFHSYKTHIDTQITNISAKVVKMEGSVKFVADNFDQQKLKNEQLENEINQLKKSLKDSSERQTEAIDALEQYSRRNCALLHGVPETANENTDKIFMETIQQHLGVEVKLHDLDRSHRIGAARSDGSGRPIIVKFARYNVRARVFREKRKFKNSGLMITESLTKRRVAALNAARNEHGKTNVWTSDGEILVLKDKKKINVRDI